MNAGEVHFCYRMAAAGGGGGGDKASRTRFCATLFRPASIALRASSCCSCSGSSAAVQLLPAPPLQPAARSAANCPSGDRAMLSAASSAVAKVPRVTSLPPHFTFAWRGVDRRAWASGFEAKQPQVCGLYRDQDAGSGRGGKTCGRGSQEPASPLTGSRARV